MEDYEKKYKEALGRANAKIETYNHLGNASVVKSICEIFPELKESEDERVRKSIIDLVEKQMPKSENKKWMIAWLEKQGEQKSQGNSALEIWKDMRLEVYQQASGNRHTPNYSDDSTKMFSLTDIDEIFEKVAEKQCEQKTTNKIKPRFKVGDTIRPKGSMAEYTIESIYGECYHGKGWGLTIGCDEDYELVEQKPTDKVEPKFKVGDWIYHEISSNTFRINKIENGLYVSDEGATISLGRQNDWRLWTIQDAKDGDVLSYVTDEGNLWIMIYRSLYKPYEGHVHYHALIFNNDFTDRGTCHISIEDLNPATKEQRDFLFQKMKEAGYEWDAEKKELKKISVQSAWSEEDEKTIDEAISLINMLASGYGEKVTEPITFNGVKMINNIKERLRNLHQKPNHWKPSDEQMEALLKLEEMHVLEHEKNQENAHLYMVIKSLKEQLLKLKEE